MHPFCALALICAAPPGFADFHMDTKIRGRFGDRWVVRGPPNAEEGGFRASVMVEDSKECEKRLL